MLTRLATCLAAAALVLAACGGSEDISDESASTILKTAQTELKDAKSVKLEGKLASDGSTLNIDLSYVGDDAEGTVTVDDIESTLLSVNDKTYVKFGDAFYEQTFGDKAQQAKQVVGDRWIEADADDPNFKDLLSFLDRKKFAEAALEAEGKPKKVDGKKIDGTETVGLSDDEGVLYVDQESGRPLSIQSKGSKNEGEVTFSYDDIDTPQAPAKDDVVTLAELNKIG
ncbi:MAG: hypothetical protein JWP31_1422 [Aeromicrobium sp.]|nr:hypothetical protein [Aeromicrobium sp.]